VYKKISEEISRRILDYFWGLGDQPCRLQDIRTADFITVVHDKSVSTRAQGKVKILFSGAIGSQSSFCWVSGPYFERSLCFFAYDIVRHAYMNLRRPPGAYGKPDTNDPIQGSLRQHDVIPGR